MTSNPAITIATGRRIGSGEPVFVIAEIGVNHNGDYDLALRMVRAAAESGADAVKFQTFRTEEFLSDPDMTYTYRQDGATVTERQWDMFKRLEMPLDWYEPLFGEARSLGIIPFTSVADSLSLRSLQHLDLPIMKLASEDLINITLLDAIKPVPMPIILSTGMADEPEIAQALHRLDRTDIILLHCVSLYPTPPEALNLARIRSLRNRFGLPCGFSDHSASLHSGAIAVGWGACVVEKHFTLDNRLPGPDHRFSLNPEAFAAYTRHIREAEKMTGHGQIPPDREEAGAAIQFRRGITCACDIPAGTRISREHIVFQRPCPALKPYQTDRVIGKVTRHALKQGDKIRAEDLLQDSL